MEPAPFFDEIADALPGAAAHWVTAADGIRVRVASLGTGANGTVLLLPGRTEFVEKYGPAGRSFAARGYGTLAVDWRGQGLTDRALPNRLIGHVEDFAEYQRDLGALRAAAEALGAPRPWHLLGHSMGGAIGLRAALSGLPVVSAVFTGPMWGIRILAPLRPLAWSLGPMLRPVGFGGQVVPTMSARNYLLSTPFEGNLLTSDPETFAWMQAQLRARPELGLGGPSIAWVAEALREAHVLRRSAPPLLPGLCICGEFERIVDIDAMRGRMADWPDGAFVLEKGAQHEVLMERPEIREPVFDRICAHFRSAEGRAETGAATPCPA
jgi:lysophospholipase